MKVQRSTVYVDRDKIVNLMSNQPFTIKMRNHGTGAKGGSCAHDITLRLNPFLFDSNGRALPKKSRKRSHA